MRTRTITCKIILLILFAIPISKSFAGTEKTLSATIESFCQEQFNGNLSAWEEDKQLVKFSKKRLLLEHKKDPEFEGRAITILGDSILVVSSYKIKEIKNDNYKAIADVEYNIVATTIGTGDLHRQFKPIADRGSEKRIVRFHLEKEGPRWKFVDPPPPLVSLQKLIEGYKQLVEEIGRNITSHGASNAQRAQYHKYKQDLEVLQKLPTNRLLKNKTILIQ